MAKKNDARPIKNVTRQNGSMYVLGNLAVQTQPELRPEQRPDIRIVRRQRRAPKAATQLSLLAKVSLLIVVAAILLGGVMIVDQYAAVSNNNALIAEKQQQIEDLLREQEQLEVRLAMSVDIPKVMAIASEQLDMHAPDNENCRAVALTVQAETDAVMAQTEEKPSLLAKIGQLAGLLH